MTGLHDPPARGAKGERQSMVEQIVFTVLDVEQGCGDIDAMLGLF